MKLMFFIHKYCHYEWIINYIMRKLILSIFF